MPFGIWFNLDISASFNGRTAPGTIGQLAWRTDTTNRASTMKHTPILFARLLALFGCVRRRTLTNPQAQTERCSAPRALWVILPDHFTGTDKRRCSLKLLEREQTQCVAHNHCNAVLA